MQADGRFGNSEYYYSFVHNPGAKYTGTEAHAYCSRLGNGWYAVGVNDAEENNFINGVITGSKLTVLYSLARIGVCSFTSTYSITLLTELFVTRSAFCQRV